MSVPTLLKIRESHSRPKLEINLRVAWDGNSSIFLPHPRLQPKSEVMLLPP
jgi:hypothetical protein